MCGSRLNFAGLIQAYHTTATVGAVPASVNLNGIIYLRVGVANSRVNYG